MDDCPDCLKHSSGCCFKHKMQYMRETGGLQVVAGRPSNRMLVEEEHRNAAIQGRKIRKKE